MMNYEMIVGLEVHAELKTETKLFCSCSNRYGDTPNTNICPVCLAMPGTATHINGECIRKAVSACLALHCGIADTAPFDHKHYFYPDLPIGYQRTQYRTPLGSNGYIALQDGRKIGIERVHMEEDAGKLLHRGNISLVDYNRAGIPLIEIVSRPDLRSAADAKEYLTALREFLLFAEVSDCKMNEGSLRCDVNLSVHMPDTPFGVRTEIKNVNSIAFVGKAIEAEFARQVAILENGGTVTAETLRYDEHKNATFPMRTKETAGDYRYSPAPDIPPVTVTQEEIEQIRTALPAMPDIRRKAYVGQGISEQTACILTQTKELADAFEQSAGKTQYPAVLARLLTQEVLPKECKIPFETVARIADLLGGKALTPAAARTLITLCENGEDPHATAERNHLLTTAAADLPALVREVIANNPDIVAQIRNGHPRAVGALVGAVMKATKGQADGNAVKALINAECGIEP